MRLLRVNTIEKPRLKTWFKTPSTNVSCLSVPKEVRSFHTVGRCQ